MTRLQRFMAKVRKTHGCWQWTASRMGSGYGQFAWRTMGTVVTVGAHRAAWQLFNGKISPGLFVCHKCSNKLCVNPSHLYLDTPQGNTREAVARLGSWGGPPRRSSAARKPRKLAGDALSVSDIPVGIARGLWRWVVRGPGGCWNFVGSTGARSSGLRGSVRIHGKSWNVTRVAYALHHGRTPRGLWVLHSCDNAACINPDHLHLGTAADNSAECVARGRHRSGARKADACSSAKLSWVEVRAIRRMHRRGWSTYRLATRYGMARATIGQVVRGKTWIPQEES